VPPIVALSHWSLPSTQRSQLPLALSLFAVLVAIACHLQSAYRATRATDAESRQQHLLDRVHSRPDGGSASDVDYVQHLRLSSTHSSSVDALVRELQSAGEGLGVTVVAVTSSARAAMPQSLGRVDMTLTLRGRYPALKQSLADLLSRHPAAVLQHLTLRRLSTSGDVEAQWALSVLAAPQPEPVAAAVMH
jgi:hypothetical protein